MAAVIPSRLRGLVFFLLLAPLAIAFAWQDELATFSDDSASYLTLAHYFAGTNGFAAEWAGYHSNFPPLFPLLLALTGGVTNLHVAYVGIALCAAGGVALFYRYAAAQIGERGALVVALLFLCSATAWVSLKGVLSEPLYLLMSMAALQYHDSRLATRRDGARGWEWLVFGLLLAAACLSRVIGFFLVGAYLAHVIFGSIGQRKKPRAAAWLPLAPVVALFGLWQWVRPRVDFDAYAFATRAIAGDWIAAPGAQAAKSWQIFGDAWIRLFVADHDVGMATKIVFAIVGVVAIAGAIRRARQNRLDGWYALFTVAFVMAWPIVADNSRRLLYPVLPVLILQAALLVRAVLDRPALKRQTRIAVTAVAAALPLLLCLPALALIAHKSLDRRVIVEGCPNEFREVAEYYTRLSYAVAADAANSEGIMLCGLRAIDRIAPPDAVVMWMRPEYIAILGKRKAVAYRFDWTPERLAAEIRRLNVSFLVVSDIGKTDYAGMWGPALSAAPNAQPVLVMPGGVFFIERVQ